MAAFWRIYALTDPDTGAVGYVGRSTSPEARYRQHCREPGGRGEPNTDGALKHQWLRTLRAAGREPQLVVLDTAFDLASAKALETTWIAHFRLSGEAAGNGHDRRGPRGSQASRPSLSGPVLQRARVAAGMTQAAVGGAIGVSESAVSRWESGSRVIPRPAESALVNLLPRLRGRKTALDLRVARRQAKARQTP